jgi:hypothetical protein
MKLQHSQKTASGMLRRVRKNKNAKSAAVSAALSATRKEERKNEKEEGINFI